MTFLHLVDLQNFNILKSLYLLLTAAFFLFRYATSRLRNKVYKYALFDFLDGRNVGTALTASISEGYWNKIKENEYVILNWEGSRVWGFILKLHGKRCLINKYMYERFNFCCSFFLFSTHPFPSPCTEGLV